MRQIAAIWSKEFKDYFVSPIAYMVIAIFLLITGWFFFSSFFVQGQASMRSFFQLLPLIFAFVIPALTMRLFSEEFNMGTYEMLITLPVTLRQVVVGKFLAGLAFVAAMLLPTLAYPLCISLIAKLDWGPVIGGYIGALLLGGAFTAIGLLTSAITHNQIIAFILGTLFCFVLAIVDKMLFFFPESFLDVIQYFAADYHFQNIAKGIIDSRDLLYFLSLIFIGQYVTHLLLQARE